jgi:hypothetical protein
MQEDKLHDFLQTLYSYRIVFGIYLFVSGVVFVSLFLNALRSIVNFVKDTIAYFNKNYRTKNNLQQETLQLAKEIESFITLFESTNPILDSRDVQGSLIQRLQHSQSFHAAYKQQYVDRIESVRKKLYRYKLVDSELDRLYKSPSNYPETYTIISSLRKLANEL